MKLGGRVGAWIELTTPVTIIPRLRFFETDSDSNSDAEQSLRS